MSKCWRSVSCGPIYTCRQARSVMSCWKLAWKLRTGSRSVERRSKSTFSNYKHIHQLCLWHIARCPNAGGVSIVGPLTPAGRQASNELLKTGPKIKRGGRSVKRRSKNTFPNYKHIHFRCDTFKVEMIDSFISTSANTISTSVGSSESSGENEVGISQFQKYF